MAERRPVRSSSRRTTPQASIRSKAPAPSPPQQTKRITRNQSREISDTEAKHGNTQDGRRSARGSSMENGGGKIGRKAKQGTQKRILPDLPTVSEADDSTLRYPGLPADDNGKYTKRDGRETKSPGNMSAMSGTTAQTSFSAQELADMNSGEMLDALPDLSEAADKILNFAVYPGSTPESLAKSVKELQDPSSRARKNLTRLGDSLQLHKRPFGNELYVNLSIGLRGLLGIRHVGSVSDGPWRPDDIFYKANLATMITGLLSSQESSSSSQSTVEKMERDFPSPFFSQLVDSSELSRKAVGCSSLASESFEVALDLRTQYFIMLVQRHLLQPNFDPDLLLLQVFYENEDSLKGWDAEGMQKKDFGIDVQNAISGRINKIKGTFREDSQSVRTGQLVDLDQLRNMYPWSTFIVEVLSWGKLRNSEIQAEINSRGSVGGIRQALEVEIRERALLYARDDAGTDEGDSPHIQIDYHPASDITSEHVNLPIQTPVTGPRKSLSRQFDKPGSIRFVKKLVAAKSVELAAQLQTARVFPVEKPKLAALAGPSTQAINPTSRHDLPVVPSTAPAKVTTELSGHERVNDDFQPPIEDDEIQLIEDREPSPTDRIIELEEDGSREQDKENIPQRPEATLKSNSRSFIDRQPNAKKIPFESQSASQQGSTVDPKSQRRQQIAEVENDDEDQPSSPSEDEGFQVDNRKNFRQPQIPVRSTKRVAPVAALRSSAKRTHHAQERQEERGVSAGLDPEYRNATRNASNAAIPSQGEMYRTVNTQSKAVTRVRLPKKIQVRRPWSEAETDRLIDLIEEHGISWAFIQSIDAGNGGVLGYRDQVALKDKARNIKFDYLKTGIALPQNFELIPLAKAQKDKLRVVGMLDESDEDDGE